jgi:hypothetical protein
MSMFFVSNKYHIFFQFHDVSREPVQENDING